VRVEVVAVGTELLLGQIANTNAAWLGDRLASLGVDCHYGQVVGDNHARIVRALRTALSRADGVIVCGGLGPTQDDITREAIAEVMNVALERHDELLEVIAKMFAARDRQMPDNNARQADVPRGATVIEQRRGTAPGLLCPVGGKVIYAVPGVPYEMSEMFDRAIAPDLEARLVAEGRRGTLRSKVLRTWGTSESALAEALAERFELLETGEGSVTIAFLASGIEGIKVRLTARGADEAEAQALLAAEELAVRAALERQFGDVVFGVDDETMEHAIAALLLARGEDLAVAESVTGGLMAARLVDVVGASAWFRGGIVAYASEVKFSLLSVPEGPVVTAAAAEAMAAGVRDQLGAAWGLSVTGVAGPEPQDGEAPGTVFVGLAGPDGRCTHTRLRLPGDRPRVRQYSVISALDFLRRTLTS